MADQSAAAQAAQAVSIDRDGPVMTITLNRPDVRNAVDRPTADALARAFLIFDRDPEAQVGVFHGANGTFCAGADLKAIADGRGNRMQDLEARSPNDPLSGTGPMGPSRMTLSKPVIAAVAGHAVAGGMELALWCDLRVMEETAVMGIFCRRWGVPLIDGGTVRLPRLIGQSRALDLILTGRPVGAREALEMGLANRVVSEGTARTEAEALAREIARFPKACMANDRRSVYEQWDLPFAAALANEFRLGRETLASGEILEGASKFAGGKGRRGAFDDI